VLILVHLAIAAHIAHWLSRGETISPVEPSEAMAFVQEGLVNAGLIFFLLAIVATAVFGRFFCGWACHLVALQDLCRWGLERVGIRPRPLRSRALAWVPSFAFLYMFVWPALYRLWIGSPLPPVEAALTTSAFWATFPGWVIGFATFAICGFVIVYFLGAKGFCFYACPYGAAFGVAERLSPLRIRVTDACEGCGHCTASCTSGVRVHAQVRDFGQVVDPGCMKCLDCVSVCPKEALYYGSGPPAWSAKPRVAVPSSQSPRFTWPEEIVLGVSFVACFFVARGLYGVVPFLLSLGAAAIFAYGVVLLFGLLTRSNLAIHRLALKRHGKWATGAYPFVGAMVVLLFTWGHSAIVRWHQHRADQVAMELAGLSSLGADIAAPRALTENERVGLDRLRGHLNALERWSPFPVPGHAARRAWTAAAVGDLEVVETASAEALERGEDVPRMHLLRAATAWQRGDAASAYIRWESAVAADPRIPGAWVNAGVAMARAGDLSRARAWLERARLALPQSAAVLYNLGLVYALLSQPEPAIALFRECLEIDPSHLEASENLAGVLASIGRFEESVQQYRRALALSSEDSRTHTLLARALRALGRNDEADLEESLARKLDTLAGLQQ
jgi:polyferredoxin/Flp pilus assembly protein TadD